MSFGHRLHKNYGFIEPRNYVFITNYPDIFCPHRYGAGDE